MVRMTGKIRGARQNPVIMEIKNMLVSGSIGSKKKPTHSLLGAREDAEGAWMQKGEGEREALP